MNQRSTNFIPLIDATAVPKEKRDETAFDEDLRSWLANYKQSGSLGGDDAFIRWYEHTVRGASEDLRHLFFRYGVPPSLVIDRLTGWKDYQLALEKYGGPSRRILRSRKLRE